MSTVNGTNFSGHGQGGRWRWGNCHQLQSSESSRRCSTKCRNWATSESVHGQDQNRREELEHGAWSVEHGAWSMEHGAWSMEHGAWSMEHGAWSMEHGAWSMEHGAWRLEHGAWSM